MSHAFYIAKLSKFGKVETCISNPNLEFEFKITTGFKSLPQNLTHILDLCDEIAGPEYTTIKKLVTGDNLFHLILTKTKSK